MAGIASDRGTQLQVGPAAEIGEVGGTVPAVNDFMDAFRQGFITVDDINRRAGEQMVRPSEIERQRTENEQATLDTQTIRPLARTAAAQQLGDQISTADLAAEIKRRRMRLDNEKLQLEEAFQPVAQKQVSTAVAKTTGTPVEQAGAVNEEQDRAVIENYGQLFGRVPEKVKVSEDVAPVSLKQWLEQEPSTQEHLASIPEGPGKQETVKLFMQKLASNPKIQAEYELYKKHTKELVKEVGPEDPKYYEVLREQIVKKQKSLGTQAAELKALPGILEAEAKEKAGRPAAIQKEISQLDTDMKRDTVLGKTRLQMAAVQQIKDLTSKPNPSNQDDLGLIYATVRALDPTSAVREGEISLLQKGVGLPTNLTLAWNRIFGNPNSVLTPEIRQNLRGLAETQAQSASVSALPELRKFYERAVASNLPVTQIFSDPELQLLISGASAAPAPASTPAPAPVPSGGSQKIQNGVLYERQPDGSYKPIRRI